MKPAWLAAGLLIPAALGVILYAHSLDPRPLAEEMRLNLRAASAELEALDLSGLGADAAFATLLTSYHETSARVAEASLAYLEDANVRDFAERIAAEAPARAADLEAHVPAATGAGDAAALDAARAQTMAAIRTGIAHKGAPDEIFVQTMLALLGGAVTAAELERESSDDPVLAASAEDVLLRDASAIGSMNRWLRFNPHQH